jgi:hypothetical protein
VTLPKYPENKDTPLFLVVLSPEIKSCQSVSQPEFRGTSLGGPARNCGDNTKTSTCLKDCIYPLKYGGDFCPAVDSTVVNSVQYQLLFCFVLFSFP